MDGQAGVKRGVWGLAQSALGFSNESGIALSDSDGVIPHQANVRILNLLGRKLGIPEEKIVITLDKHANTSAASVPLAFDVAFRDGRIKAGPQIGRASCRERVCQYV